MTLFLVDHLDGCKPLQPCKSCEAAVFLKSKLSVADFDHLVEMVSQVGQPIEPIGDDEKIEALRLETRSFCTLKNHNIVTVGQLVQKTREELIRMPNLGKISVTRLQGVLARRGRKLLGEP